MNPKLFNRVKNDKPTHGGPRENSGRKPDPNKKQAKTYKLSVDLIEYLATTDNATAAIEEALRNSKAYKLWKKSRA